MSALSLLVALVLALPGLSPDPLATTLILDAARQTGVPPTTLAALCVLESGASPARTPLWCGVAGVTVAQQPYVAARALAHWRRVCHTERDAVIAWRYGRGCRAEDPSGYAVRALRLARRVWRLAGFHSRTRGGPLPPRGWPIRHPVTAL